MVVVGIFAVVVSVFANGFVWAIWLDLFGFVLNYVLDCEQWLWLLVGGDGQWAVAVACCLLGWLVFLFCIFIYWWFFLMLF